jgi:hypothetical protein
MTDMEAFVEAPGRDDLVRQVRKKINELKIEYLYLQFVSVTGRICGKGIPADHWERIAERGFQLVYGATVNLFVNRHGEYMGYGPEAAELVGIPEPETFCSETARSARTPAPSSPRTAAATSIASTRNSRRTTAGCTSGTGPSRR